MFILAEVDEVTNLRSHLESAQNKLVQYSNIIQELQKENQSLKIQLETKGGEKTNG